MALSECLNTSCGALFAAGLEFCPECGGEYFQEAGMAKISKAEGPTNVDDPNLPPYPEPASEPSDVTPEAGPAEEAAAEEEETPVIETGEGEGESEGEGEIPAADTSQYEQPATKSRRSPRRY